MSCRVIAAGPSVMVIACDRGRDRPRCQSTGCTGISVALCDYPLSGRHAGKTCDRRMCAGCRRPQGPDVDYCQPHHAQARAK
jgi:hypothetical protein